MQIRKILIIQGHGADNISLLTDLPEATWPYTGSLSLTCRAAANTGPDFAAKHWPGIEVEVINLNKRASPTVPYNEKRP